MKNNKKVLPYIFSLPGMLLLFVLMYLPFLRNISYSFTNYKLTNPNYKFTGMANYLEALAEKDFRLALKTTLIWVVLNILIMMALGLIAAYVMNSRRIKGVFLLEIVLLLPWVLPEAITGYTWKLLLNYKTGIYYKLLLALRLIPERYDIFANTPSALMACVMANVWRSFPLVALTALAKLRTLSEEQIEAAILDGASRRQQFIYIEFPFIRPVLVSVGTLCFIWTFNAYGVISVMTNGGPAKGTQVVSVLMQKSAFQYYDYSMASTYAVLILIILVLIILGLYGCGYIFRRKDEE